MGLSGVDDDKNGYVDDIHGYGFGDGTGNFSPHYHGVHVGGTVAAVNDNGLGVSGIAGGRAGSNGVRVMSCAVFGSFATKGFEAAFVYAADNGAVIAQNSWGYTSPGVYEQSVLDAIDYFIAYAGYDENGLPIGPMQGGLVIFAAGNSNSSDDYYPAYYEPVLAVGSTDHDDLKSDFSNYGSWVDISAPGSQVFSTYLDNAYNYLSGTSMASPHVSGVAALAVSYFNKIKPDLLRNVLLSAADSINHLNPSYKDLLGAGRVNAFRTLQVNDSIPPSAITDLAIIEAGPSLLYLQWTSPGGSDSLGTAASYDIRYATSPIDTSNFESALVYASPPPLSQGKMQRLVVEDLTPVTQYYFAIKSSDFFGRHFGHFKCGFGVDDGFSSVKRQL